MSKRDVWQMTEPMPMGGELFLVERAQPPRSPLLSAKVMMVDDDPMMTEVIQTHLEDAGYCNFVVTNEPRDAMALLRREKPGVLLLDLMMPGLNGFELLEAIRADRELRFTPVIVLTASTGGDSKLRALQLGATDFLSKPVDASELALRVRNTLAFQQYHERLLHYDPVTGLPNERPFEQAVDALLQHRAAATGGLALLSITIPECRTLRESVDRTTADALAVVIGRRLERLTLPASDVATGDNRLRAARIGEQHFVALLDGFADADEVEVRARHVLAALAEPAPLGLHEVAPVPWIGVAMAPVDGDNALALRKGADEAASHAHRLGSVQLAFASTDLNARSLRRLTLGAQLRGAAGRGELRLHYQPKVEIAANRIVGFEALVRWAHPDRGLIPPGEFISLAEEMGLIGSIGEWVIGQACEDLRTLDDAGGMALSMAVNVSKPQLDSGRLLEQIEHATRRSGLAPQRLVIELTESMLMTDVPRCLAQMESLKALGVRLSIDDFGTGYSSLAYLKRFPLDELKVDRSFVRDLPGHERDVALVRTIVDLAHRLVMTVTAEGVERDDQLEALRSLGCDRFQGFLYSRPIALSDCQALFAAR